MKVFISADIEGITGVTHWDETELSKADYAPFREQMTAEVAAACAGALEAGAGEILVRDAHDSARNLLAAELPRLARLMRGWSGHPFTMADGLDESYDAVALVGFHSGAGFGASPLEHTMTGQIAGMKINGQPASEFLMLAYTAALVKVPLVFVSGDRGLAEHVQECFPFIRTVAVKEGWGNATVSIHPGLACERIQAGVHAALSDPQRAAHIPALPEHFRVEIEYRHAFHAYQIGFYPGMRQTGPLCVEYEHDDFFEVLRCLRFALWM